MLPATIRGSEMSHEEYHSYKMDNTLITLDEEQYIYYLVQKSGVRNNNKKVEVEVVVETAASALI
jgi:hypothetical protein